MSRLDATWNLGVKAARRLGGAHKPFVRLLRRRAREHEHAQFRLQALDVRKEIARVASGTGPIVAGPWLAEVGYEALYWVPFLRWFLDAHGVSRDRVVALSRGGLDRVYREVAGAYVDIFDLVTPGELAARNAERRAGAEGGGQKQSGVSAFDDELLQAARAGVGDAAVLHPSLMFRLFRQVWYGNLPMDVLWRHSRHALLAPPPDPALRLPADFIAAKFYGGPALTTSEATRASVRALVAEAARLAPVVVLDTDLSIDEHRDFDLRGIRGVVSLGDQMTPRTNLGVQVDAISRSRFFLGTCGGLAWLAPFLGVPTVAVYDNDELLTPHLLTARQAAARVGAAEFAPLDLRALDRVGILAPGSARPGALR